MTQDDLVNLMRECGVDAVEGTRQSQYHQVRFHDSSRRKSFNLGYRDPLQCFVADFVFLGPDRLANEKKCAAFLELYGGVRGNRDTVFARLQPGFAERQWLKAVIVAYWAVC